MLRLYVLFCLVLMGLAVPAWAQNDTLPDAIINPGPVPGHLLVVDKAEQLIYLYRHDGKGAVNLEKVMSCSTGKRKGDKMIEGDKKTPNGLYIFNEKKLPREMSPIFGILAYPTDYPNFWDRHLGRGGYGIWMHGIDKKLKDYDSNGCVELQNADIAAMEDIIMLYDTPLIIYESLVMAPVEQLSLVGDKVLSFLESWGRSWVRKEYDAYQAHYAPDFVNSDEQSFAEWMEHKKNVGQNTGTIKLGARDLRVFRHRDVVVAIFQQDYQVDDGFASSGLKRLYLRPEGDSYKIVGEEFQPLPDKTTTKWLTAGQKRKALDGAAAFSPVERGALAEAAEKPVENVESVQTQAETSEGSPGLAQTRLDKPEENTSLLQARVERPDQPEKKVPLETSESQTLNRAEDEALAREESLLNQEVTRARVKAAEGEARPGVRRDKARQPGTERPDPIAEAEARALASARDKLSGRKMSPEETKAHLIALVKAWEEAWNNRDLDKYFSFYDSSFYYEDKKLDLPAFIEYRRALIENANVLEVRLSHFSVRFQGALARVMFRQNYRSDNTRDLGRKIMMFKETDSGWKIVSETWQSF